MKILQINKFHYDRDGVTRCYFDTAKILNEKGHDIAFFSMKHPKNNPSRWSEFFVDEVDYNAKHSLVKKIKVSLNIWYNFQANRNLEMLLKEFKPDVAHLHVIYHQISPSIINVLKKHDIPVVMTLHDYKVVSPNYNLYHNGNIWERGKDSKYYECLQDKCVKNSYFKSLVCVIEAYLHKILRLYEKVDVYISPSKFLREKYIEFGFKNEIVVLNNIVVRNREFKKIKTNDKKYILYYGRLSKEKGVEDLIQAFAKSGVDCDLVIAGEGEDKNKLIKISESIKNGKVKFAGYVKGDALSNLIINSEFVVVPSVWYENYPYTVIESLNLGKKVLAPRIGGIPEMIQENINGYLYKPRSIDDLANKINYVFGQDNNIPLGRVDNKELYYKNLVSIYEKAISKK